MDLNDLINGRLKESFMDSSESKDYNRGYNNGSYDELRLIQDSLSNVEYNRKPEKAKLPKPIADYLKISKGWDDSYQTYQEDDAISLQNALSFDNFGLFVPLERWFSIKGNDEVFAQAWLSENYEVVQEPKYITALTANRGHKWLLAKTDEGNIVVEKVGFSNFEKKLSTGRYFLTEEEIKSMDRGGQLFVNYSQEVDTEKYW